MPTQRCKHTTIVGASNSSSSSSFSSGGSSSSGHNTSSESVTTSDGEDASVINLDEASWSDVSPAGYMLSKLKEFDLKDWRQQYVCFSFVLCVGRAAARTLPLRCVVPMATHTQADDTLMVIKGGANCRITPGPHTQKFGGARHFFFVSILRVFLLCMCRTLWFPDNGLSRAAARTLPYPWPHIPKPNDTLMIIRGGANWRITPRPHTQ